MPDPLTICRVAATGDVYAIFSKGREIPQGYRGVLAQNGVGLGLLAAGYYNSAIILQSLADYDGSESILYEVRDGIFEFSFDVGGLPDPGSLASRLIANVTLHGQVVDPGALIAHMAKGSGYLSTRQLGDTLREEAYMLLDPIVACEQRDHLFSPSIFHETAGLTLQDYINSTYADRGITIERITSLEFRTDPTASFTPPPPVMPQPPRRPRIATPPPRQPTSPPPVAPPASSQASSARRPQVPDWPEPSASGDLPLPPRQAPAARPEQAPKPRPMTNLTDIDAPPPARPAAAMRPQDQASFPANVAMLRAELAKNLLSSEFLKKFAEARSFRERFATIRDLDFELLLSDEKVSELAQKMTPGQFDFGWASHFFVRSQAIFNNDQMRRFQQAMAALDSANPASDVESYLNVIDSEGSREGEAEDRPISQDLMPSMPWGAGGAPDPEKPDASAHGPAPNRASEHMTPDGIVRDHENAGLNVRESRPRTPDELAPMRDEHRGAFSPDTGERHRRRIYRPPTFTGDEGAQRGPRTQAGIETAGGMPEEAADPRRIGNLEVIMGTSQSLFDKNIARWPVTVVNRTNINFSTLKLTLRASSIVSTGAGQFNHLQTGARQSIDLKLASTTPSHSGELLLRAVGYAEGGVLPYGLSYQGPFSSKSTGFAGHHEITIGASGDSDVLSPQELDDYVADLGATGGGQAPPAELRRLILRPDEEYTRRLRTRIPSAERGVCNSCGNETPRSDPLCKVCGTVLPGWFAKQPMVLTPDVTAARARVERAKLRLSGRDDSTLWIVMGGALSIGRRHDNDIVLRSYNTMGVVDERRTTELSRVGGEIVASQGSVRFRCRNRHGLRYRGKFMACDQEFELVDSGSIEFINRQSETVVGLELQVMFASGSEETGGNVGPLAVAIMQADDPRHRTCLFLIHSCTFGIEGDTGKPALRLPAYDSGAIGRLIQNDESLWLEPARPMRLRNERSGEILAIDPSQILRLDENCSMDTGVGALRAEIYHSRVPAGM